MTLEELEVWNFIQALNRSWTIENNLEKLTNFFHKDMVAITPTDPKRREGCESCVLGWKQFSDNATIHSWKESEPLVQLYGNGQFAIVSYYFEMSFDMRGQLIHLKGRDLFSLIKENGRWWIVADQYSPMPQ